MKILISLFGVAVASFIAIAPAAALPASAEVNLDRTIESPVIQTQMRDRKNVRRARAQAPRYRAGGRYRTAPSGWHRHASRPGDWRTRGCVMAGPIWFCP